jgi:hypothetical protein
MTNEQRNAMDRFSDMLWALGDGIPSQAQVDRIVSWTVLNIASEYWHFAANEAAMAGCGAVYAELTMRIGEGC